MAAPRRKKALDTPAAAAPARPFEPMQDPLHPMHQDLLRRIAADHAHSPTGLSRPARFATIFYLGLGAWGLVGASAIGLYALL